MVGRQEDLARPFVQVLLSLRKSQQLSNKGFMMHLLQGKEKRKSKEPLVSVIS